MKSNHMRTVIKRLNGESKTGRNELNKSQNIETYHFDWFVLWIDRFSIAIALDVTVVIVVVVAIILLFIFECICECVPYAKAIFNVRSRDASIEEQLRRLNYFNNKRYFFEFEFMLLVYCLWLLKLIGIIVSFEWFIHVCYIAWAAPIILNVQ